jgi:DNA-binding NarL/FixJ family response regulator
VLTVAIDDAQVVQALEMGARGIVLKEAATELLFKAIRTVVAGQYWVGRDTVSDIMRLLRERSAAAARRRLSPAERLTPREREIVAAVAAGESNRDVAKRLFFAEGTVKHHIINVFDKLGVSTGRSSLLRGSHGWPSPSPPQKRHRALAATRSRPIHLQPL